MHKIGLYHPQIHFPSDKWIKVAALYWTKVARIVPYGYVTHDSETVKKLQDNLGFVVNIDPVSHREITKTFRGACDEFYEFVTYYGNELEAIYGFKNDHLRDGRPAGYSSVATVPDCTNIVDDKIEMQTRYLLDRHNLTWRSDNRAPNGQPILRMHPTLARVYMSALAEDIARANHLRPVTDDSGVYEVGTGWTEDRMRNVLIPDAAVYRSPYPQEEEHRAHRLDTPDLIGMIAIQTVIPQDVDRLSVDKIIQIRKRFGRQFLNFRETVDSVARRANRELERIQEPAVVRAYLEQEVHERLLVPVQQLRRDMSRLKIETATATLTFKYEVPALASLIAGGMLSHEPLIAGSATVAVGLLGLARGMHRQAAVQFDASPVSYLMILQNHLEARSILHRAARRIHRITRSD
jgi:hypothetical protein